MSTIRFHQTTTSTPEQFVAGLTDFGPGRSKLFGNSADSYLKVHSRGSTEADVTEGSGGIWVPGTPRNWESTFSDPPYLPETWDGTGGAAREE
jgi:hypothetical protein